MVVLTVLVATTTVPLDDLKHVKLAVPVVLLAVHWCYETWRPFIGQHEGRVRREGHNLAIAIFNTVILGLVFGFVTWTVAGWTEQNQYGLLNASNVAGPVQFIVALVLLDGWMYARCDKASTETRMTFDPR